MTPGRWCRLAAAAACLAVATPAAGGRAVADEGVQIAATVDGQPVGTSSQNQPVRLYPRQQSVLSVTVTNRGSVAILVRQVRLEGQVIGLTFFAYDTAVSMPVAPGASETQNLSLDLSGLNGQATGLIPGRCRSSTPTATCWPSRTGWSTSGARCARSTACSGWAWPS